MQKLCLFFLHFLQLKTAGETFIFHQTRFSFLKIVMRITKSLLRLRETQKALQCHSSFSRHFFWTDWQKLFSKFCPIAALSACHQDRS